MEHLFISPERRVRVLSVGLAASVALYALVVMVAEPMRALGATSDSETAVVQPVLA